MKNLQATAMSLVLLLAVFLSGCIPSPEPPPLPMPPSSQVLPEPLPERMTIDVYWDATVSMQGFTKLAAGNVYRTLPDTLGDLGGSMGEVRFFRFGEQVTPVEGREYRRFSNPDCYTELITSFGSVLNMADPEHLSIVVTDLFESDADWSNVTQKLREKYFANHMAVGIIGIKNSFNGEIFDVGLNAAKFSYNSGDDPARFRPFYLFLMGSEPQVRAFLEQWEERQIPAGEIQYVVFSEYFTSKIMTFRLADADAKGKNNLFEDRRLPKADDRLQEVSIANRDKNVEITIPGNLQQYPHACTLIKDKLEKHVRIFAWSEGDENQQGNWQQQEGQNADVTFDFVNDEAGNNCTLKLVFLPNSTLPPGRIGLVQVQIAPSRQSVDLPIWISDWDMGNIDISPELFDGAKTVNLKHIADSLKDSLMAAVQPTIAELDLLIDGR